MPPRKPAAQPQPDQQSSAELQQQTGNELQQAQAELARMEETQRLCFRYQNNLTKLAEELRQRQYPEYDITYLLKPKGSRKIPGYELAAMTRQKKYIEILKNGPKPATSHAEAVEQSRQHEDELAR